MAKHIAYTDEEDFCENCPNWDSKHPDIVTEGFGFCSFHDTPTGKSGICHDHPKFSKNQVKGICTTYKGKFIEETEKVSYEEFVEWSAKLLKDDGSRKIRMEKFDE